MFKLAVFIGLALACPGISLPSKSNDICRYFLYQRATGLQPIPIFTESLRIAGIDETLTTVILVHGHGGSAFSSLNPDIIGVMLNVEEVNIITVDWSTFAAGSYSSAVTAVPLVAQSLRHFINALASLTPPVYLANVHIVGFNLGAHVAGIAARGLTPKVARITGLDPSGSQWGSNSARLTSTDASYVEVLHTDGGGLFGNGIGTAIGTVDFFANGGNSQPGCLTHACSHNRAYELFAASLVNPNLIGYLCTSSVQMTLNLCRSSPLRMGTNELSKIGSGTYRINTGRRFPF